MSTHTIANIIEIRDRLNELPFRNGKRQVLIGRISDRFVSIETTDSDDDDDDTVSRYAAAIEHHLEELSDKLRKHNLEVARGDDDPDQLYAMQQLRQESEVDLSWMGEAMAWSYRIMAVALVMVLPVVAGMWLDARFGTRFITVLSLCIGPPLGLWHLIRVTRQYQAVADRKAASKE